MEPMLCWMCGSAVCSSCGCCTNDACEVGSCPDRVQWDEDDADLATESLTLLTGEDRAS
jgi:hypothetical protein